MHMYIVVDMIGGIDKTIKNATNVLNFLNNTKEIK